MQKLHANGYSVADNLLAAFAATGYWPEPGDKILDFGCGGGGLVYELRDRGFDARGFDIYSRPDLRDPGDAHLFTTLAGEERAVNSDTRIDRATFRAPLPDESFDIIVSTSVLEHVMDLSPFIAETARLLKPGGFAYHLYPNRDVFIEPHIFVPWSSRIQNWPWFYFWGLMGIRNDFQKDMTARQVADNNMLYCRTGLKYRSRKKLRKICAEHFGVVRFVDDAYYPLIGEKVFRKNKLRALRAPNPLVAYSQTLKMGSLFTQKLA